jgi:hypothetical protein
MRFGLAFLALVTAGLLLGGRMGLADDSSACAGQAAKAPPAQAAKPVAHPPDLPGPIHEGMAKRAGQYTTATRFALSPEAKPEETTGTAKITSVVDGHFLLEENAGKMLGQEYKGLRLWGYNGAAGQFEATWTYSQATGMMRLVGTSKDEGQTINWTATADQAKGSKMTLHAVTRLQGPDQFTVELYMKQPDGKKGPAFVTTYTRKK